MLQIAHLIHPVIVSPASDLLAAQPVTFETMQRAKVFARNEVDVLLYAIQYVDEERMPLPPEFIRTADLNRSVGNVKSFRIWRKLAMIKDLLDTLYRSTEAEYLIYTNVDIALQPFFYSAVARLIATGYDAFIINRRTISGRHTRIEDLPFMYAEPGEPHPGWDCFIFKRSLYPRFRLGQACIGTGWIGRVLVTNMATLGSNFQVFTDLHMTFHLGNELAWKSSQYSDYSEHNKNECKEILLNFEKEFGPYDRSRLPGQYFRHFS